MRPRLEAQTASSITGRFNAGSIVENPATPPLPGPQRCTSGPIAFACGSPAVVAFHRYIDAVGAVQFVGQLLYSLLIERGLRARKMALRLHLGLVRQIVDDSLVGLQPP